MDIFADLEQRDLLHTTTDRASLAGRLAESTTGIYVGFDPSADSLHIGNLVGQLALRRFQDAGHRPFVLAGGATGMVGDPGGRSEERLRRDLRGQSPPRRRGRRGHRQHLRRMRRSARLFP